jgi:hypothetical protein
MHVIYMHTEENAGDQFITSYTRPHSSMCRLVRSGASGSVSGSMCDASTGTF